MNTEELTQVVTAHQSAIARHSAEMSELRGTLITIGQTLERIATQQETNTRQIEANNHQGELNQEAIATLTASILDLRNLVADYIQGRSQD